jgi:hypothetical protein
VEALTRGEPPLDFGVARKTPEAAVAAGTDVTIRTAGGALEGAMSFGESTGRKLGPDDCGTKNQECQQPTEFAQPSHLKNHQVLRAESGKPPCLRAVYHRVSDAIGLWNYRGAKFRAEILGQIEHRLVRGRALVLFGFQPRGFTHSVAPTCAG